MKQRYRLRVRSALNASVRRLLLKLYRCCVRYFSLDESIVLNELDRYRDWQIGDYSYGHPSGSPKIIHFGEPATLKVGKFCAFAEDVRIVFGGYHRTDWVTTYPFSVLFDDVDAPIGIPIARGDIIIGNDVWVCTGAMIMAGVTIGDGAVIAAGSVVSKDVPPYAVVAGNPARVVKTRFSEELIAKLQKIAWWYWPEEKIRSECPMLLSNDVEGFVNRHFTVQDSEGSSWI